MTRFLQIIIGSWALLMWLCVPFSAQATPSKEYLVKAAFIYNFTKFVEWPSADKTINLCMVGSHGYDGTIKEIEKRSNSKIRYRVFDSDAKSNNCQAYIYDKLPASIPQQPNLLTIGEGKGFIEQGGVIAFVPKSGKIKFIINLPAARKAGLKMNPQLLEIADEVIR